MKNYRFIGVALSLALMIGAGVFFDQIVGLKLTLEYFDLFWMTQMIVAAFAIAVLNAVLRLPKGITLTGIALSAILMMVGTFDYVGGSVLNLRFDHGLYFYGWGPEDEPLLIQLVLIMQMYLAAVIIPNVLALIRLRQPEGPKVASPALSARSTEQHETPSDAQRVLELPRSHDETDDEHGQQQAA